jgi:hypothetical protein
MNSNSTPYRLTSLQRNRIALDYVKYREEIEDEKKGGGTKILWYEYALENFKEEARKRGLYEKVKTLDRLKNTRDYS